MATNLLLRQKYHQYKSFSPTGTYLGLIQNIKETFNYNQTIASAFAQIQFTVEQSADVASQAVTPITDEQGNAITDEAGNPLLIERQPDIVGSNNSNALIANNNLLQVWEYSNYYPNGILKFSGYISKWKTTFGSTDDILVTAISNGQDLGQYLISSGDTAYITQNVDDGSTQPLYTSATPVQFGVGQTFTVAAALQLGGISIELTTAEIGTLYIGVYAMSGTSPNPQTPFAAGGVDAAIASGTLSLGILSSKTVEKIGFSALPTLNPSTTYYFWVTYVNNSGDAAQAFVYTNAANPYANGQLYTGQNHFTGFWTTSPVAGSDMYFIVYQHGGAITGTYTNDDPSFIISDVMNNYASQGGLITQPVGGYTNTGTITSYTFKQQTILQALQAIINLSPATWYWYIDPATGVLHFAKQNSVADIVIIKGRHINELDIEATKENIINQAYFTGGDDGTNTSTNILVKVQGVQGSNRVGLAQLSDNRVNSTTGGVTTARLIANNYINSNNAETYITNVTIQDQAMDINLITLGQSIGFSGFGNFVDNLLLQVVGLNYQSDQVVLQLGTLPKRPTKAFADAQASLAYTQTVANPSTPS